MDIEDHQDAGELIKKKLKARSKSLLRARKPGTVQASNPDRRELLRYGEGADKQFFDTRPKHLLTGKRGVGKNERR